MPVGIDVASAPSADPDGLPMTIGTRCETADGGMPTEASTLLTDELSPAESVGTTARPGPVSKEDCESA